MNRRFLLAAAFEEESQEAKSACAALFAFGFSDYSSALDVSLLLYSDYRLCLCTFFTTPVVNTM